MFCKSCGSQNPSDAKFCSRCGKRIELDTVSDKRKKVVFTLLGLIVLAVIAIALSDSKTQHSEPQQIATSESSTVPLSVGDKPQEPIVAGSSYYTAPPPASTAIIMNSDGTSSQIIGNTAFHSDGTTSTRMGSTVLHSDGTSSNIVGNTAFHSNGETSTVIGSTVFNSDGSTVTVIGGN